MKYLAREDAPFSSDVWDEIDKTVVDTLKKHLVCRRFLSLFGPLGAGVSFIPIDSVDKTEALSNGFGEITGRKIVQMPQLYLSLIHISEPTRP